MTRKNVFAYLLGAAIALPAVVMAEVIFDPLTGTGFVGKGDVQAVYGWNNEALQDNAFDVQFRVSSTMTSEVSWTCWNRNNNHTQTRTRTTTGTFEGLVSSEPRVHPHQVTGFLLNGYESSTITDAVTDGPPLNSCPNGPWSLQTPAAAPSIESEEGAGLQVSIDGFNWYDLE